MEYITHNQADINPIGTWLMGHCESETTYHKLVSVFGEPQDGDAYKVDAEWVLRFSDDLVATIYNYKTGKNYLGEDGKEKEDISGHEWHIGGTTAEVVSRIHGIISGNPCYKLIGSDAKQAKHTQGPWMVRKSAHDDNIYYLWDEDGNYHEGQTQEEEIKNAVLMENAPELLEALQLVANCVTDDKGGVTLGSYELGVIKAAISKAKGE